MIKLLCVCVTKLIAAVTGRGRGLASNKMDGGGRVLPWAAGREREYKDKRGKLLMANAITTAATE